MTVIISPVEVLHVVLFAMGGALLKDTDICIRNHPELIFKLRRYPTARAVVATENAVKTADVAYNLQDPTAKRQLRAYMTVKGAYRK